MSDRPTARFVVSIDLEMSWGAIHHGRPHDDRPYRQEREIVADVLESMERHRISATWAVVGHLFLDRCTAEAGPPHPEVERPAYGWLDGDWYDLDPAGSLGDHPTWYGPDLVEAIRGSAVHQEIGSHSFAHLIAGEEGCTAGAFRSDLEAAKAVADGELRSFVYPRNSIGHLDVLADEGFIAYRGAMPDRFAGRSRWQRRMLTMADHLRPFASVSVQPAVRGPLVDIPQTYLFDPGSATAERFGTAIWGRLVRRRLRHAVRSKSLFHLWFHTHNFAGHRPRAVAAMDAVFGDARRLIDAGQLENPTMGALAEQLLAGEVRG